MNLNINADTIIIIQVEHTITEQTHDGLDLVELMIKQCIAESLVEKGLSPKSTEMIQATYDNMVAASITKGASNAVEARIYAENPNEIFIPSPGLLQYVNFGDANEHWRRVDSWVRITKALYSVLSHTTDSGLGGDWDVDNFFF